jgi:hypothetical protein
MKRLACSFAFLYALAAAVLAGGAETEKLIPDSCTTVVSVYNIQSDPGISWMLDAWIKAPRQSPLRELLKTVVPQEMSVAFFPEKKDAPMNLLAAMALPKGAKVDKGRVSEVIKGDEGSNLDTVSYKGTTITYTKGQKGPEDFGAYTMLGDRLLIFGSDTEILKQAIDGPPVDKAPNYQKIRGQFPQAKDAILFADNSGKKFSSFLKPREKKWKMTLLLSSEYLEYMASSFDVVNASKVSGTFVFQGADRSRIDEIKDDAEFMGEAFKRKFMAEKIQYSSKVEVKDSTVTLTFQIEGLEPLWKKLFEQGVLNLFRPES